MMPGQLLGIFEYRGDNVCQAQSLNYIVLHGFYYVPKSIR